VSQHGSGGGTGQGDREKKDLVVVPSGWESEGTLNVCVGGAPELYGYGGLGVTNWTREVCAATCRSVVQIQARKNTQGRGRGVGHGRCFHRAAGGNKCEKNKGIERQTGQQACVVGHSEDQKYPRDLTTIRGSVDTEGNTQGLRSAHTYGTQRRTYENTKRGYGTDTEAMLASGMRGGGGGWKGKKISL